MQCKLEMLKLTHIKNKEKVVMKLNFKKKFR